MQKRQHYQRTHSETLEQLSTQIGFLQTSCDLYDQGRHTEAARIASAVFILVNDGSQTSLLTQLKLRKEIQFISYAAELIPGNLLAEEPLVMLQMGEGSFGYIPVLNNGPTPAKHLKFNNWWEKETVFNTPHGQKLSRRGLVFAMRNQDGGSHYDPRLTDEAYVEFSKSIRWYAQSGEQVTLPTPRPHHATMRQIGFELMSSIQLSRLNAQAG